MSEAALRGHTPTNPEAMVLVLHGGGERGTKPMQWWGGPVLRMLPFALAIRHEARRTGRRVAVFRLKNAVFGWNGRSAHPLVDATAALNRITAEHPGIPVILVGHSMGGRVALRLAHRPEVRAVVALAPWIHDSDTPDGRPGQAFLLLHAREDRVTDPSRTTAYAAALQPSGAQVTCGIIPGDNHAMMRRPTRWHDRVSAFVVTHIT